MFDYICVWSDGTWCPWEEVDTYLEFMSDDFARHNLNSMDETKYTCIDDWVAEELV